ncbi:MAG: ester cyclase [Dyadobacter fermentans]
MDEAGKESTNELVIQRYIQHIWNQDRLSELDDLLHKDFIDYSIPIRSLQNRTGIRLYLEKLRSTFHHHTVINKIVECDDLVICDFTLRWQCDGASDTFSGLRIFRMKGGRILHHWEVMY